MLDNNESPGAYLAYAVYVAVMVVAGVLILWLLYN